MSLSEKLFYNFSRLFHCSIIKVLAICFRLESLIFPRKTDCFLCFRFVVSLPRQQILSYQIISCLSTLFLTFLFRFSKSLSRQRVISYQTVRRLSTLFFNFFQNFFYKSVNPHIYWIYTYFKLKDISPLSSISSIIYVHLLSA